ncbi:MAG: HEAT repeat domain-containing protein [Candidatus Brocadiia bacterium]
MGAILVGLLFFSVPQVGGRIGVQYHRWMILIRGENEFTFGSSHISGMSQYPEYSMSYIKGWFKDKKLFYRRIALEIFNDTGKSGVIYLEQNPSVKKELNDILLKIFEADDNEGYPWVRLETWRALVRLQGDKVVEYARNSLRDKSGLVRDAATELLIRHNDNDKSIISNLIIILKLCILIEAKDIVNLRRLQGDRMVVARFYEKDGLLGARFDFDSDDKDIWINTYYREDWIKNRKAAQYLTRMIGVLDWCDITNGIDKEKINRLELWWNTNNQYLYWSEKEGHFVVDQEAKAAGIPTEEYRKTHPWSKEDKSNEQPK